MLDIDERIAAAWSEAAADLGIRVEAPFALTMQSGETIWFEALIADFASPLGALACHGLEQAEAAKSQGRWFSWLWPSYQTYQRDLFIATLND